MEYSTVVPTTIMVGAIAGSIAASGARSNAQSQKIGYIIHPTYGTAIHPHEPFLEKSDEPFVQKNGLIIYRKSEKESDRMAHFLVNGEHLYSFEKKSYVLLQYPCTSNPVTLCTGPAFSDCIEVTLYPGEPAYVKCTYLKDADSPKFILPAPSQGRYDYGTVENTQNKRGRQFPEPYEKW